MATIRKIVDEADAEACLAAVRFAGGDVGCWARAHGVDGRSLIAWQSNLGRPTHARSIPPSHGVAARSRTNDVRTPPRTLCPTAPRSSSRRR